MSHRPDHMDRLLETVMQFVERKGLLGPGEGVLVGFSGGPDSVALAVVLQELSSSGRLPLQVRLAHLNHCLRGEESEAEEQFCRRFARERDVPIDVRRADVRGALSRGGSLEAAARTIRYQFLLQTARQLGVNKVAVAHHADDVAETVLLRILRGCGLRGLGAMAPARPAGAPGEDLYLVRPLLTLRKAELLDYLRAAGQDYCHDSSNENTDFVRNRIRHELIPHLSRRYATFSTGSLCALNEAALEVTHLVDELVDRNWSRLCVADEPGELVFDNEVYRTMTLAERKAAVRRVSLRLCGGAAMAPALGSEHYNAAAGLAMMGVGSQVALPGGITARMEHGLVCFRTGSADRKLASRELQVPGELYLDEAGIWISCEVLGRGRMTPPVAAEIAGPWEVYLSLDALVLPLQVRGRRPGDRFHPLGAGGERKLKEFLIDRKVPRHLRDRIPLVVAADGTIAWVVGHRIGDRFKLTGNDGSILHVRAACVSCG